MLDFSVTFIITIINICALFLILRVILFKPVTKFMEERTKRVQDSIEQSEKDKNQAKALLAKYEAQLKTAEVEVDAIIRNAKELAHQEAEKIIAESRISAEAILADAREQLQMERQTALEIFRKEAAALVIAAAGRVVSRELDNEDNRHYANLLLTEVSLSNETPRSNDTGKN